MKNRLLFVFAIVLFTFLMPACKTQNNGADIHYTLQVSMNDYLLNASNNCPDSTFRRALVEMDSLMEGAMVEDYFTFFAQVIDGLEPGKNLNSIFMTFEFKDKINGSTSNEEVLKVLKADFDAQMDKSIEVLNKRMEECGLNEFVINKSNNLGVLNAELKGVEHPDRIRKILQCQGKLEFFETYEAVSLIPFLDSLDSLWFSLLHPGEIRIDSGSKFSNPSLNANAQNNNNIYPEDDDAENDAEDERRIAYNHNHPFTACIVANTHQDQNGNEVLAEGPSLGCCRARDTADVNTMISHPAARLLLPRDLKLAWAASPIEGTDDYFSLLALKMSRDGAVLDGSVVIKAYSQMGQIGRPDVLMEMNEEGTELWKRITQQNVDRYIAMLIDGLVYSYPKVMSEIPGGRSSISANFTEEQAADLALILNAGALPLKINILKEEVVKKANEK